MVRENIYEWKLAIKCCTEWREENMQFNALKVIEKCNNTLLFEMFE